MLKGFTYELVHKMTSETHCSSWCRGLKIELRENMHWKTLKCLVVAPVIVMEINKFLQR